MNLYFAMAKNGDAIDAENTLHLQSAFGERTNAFWAYDDDDHDDDGEPIEIQGDLGSKREREQGKKGKQIHKFLNMWLLVFGSFV